MKKTIIGIFKDIRKQALIYCSLLFLVFCVCFYVKENLYHIITRPIADKMDIKDLFIYTGILDMFWADISISFSFSFVTTFPVLLFCAYRFVSPSLYKREKKTLLVILIFGLIMFYISIVITYNVIFARIVDFFISNNQAIAKPMLNINNYLSEFNNIALFTIPCFEFPVIVLCLAKFKVITSGTLLRNFKKAIVVSLIIGAVITPPDILSQLCVASILMLFYSLTMFMCVAFFEKFEK